MTSVFGLNVVAWFTDNGGEMKKARKEGARRVPQIIWGECWGHQASIVGIIWRDIMPRSDMKRRPT
jgi:hypothetical protein